MNKRMVYVAGALSLTGVLLAGAVAPRFQANAAGKKVIFVTDIGGLNDNGFNHLGYIGTVAGAKAAGWTFGDIETTNPSDYVKNLTTAAQQANMVVAVGFSFGTALTTVAAKFPKVHFTIIDYAYSPSPANILGNIFTPNESSYLAGIVAAGMSKTHTIGFVGGLNVPVIQNFLVGYKAGALSYDPKVKVLTSYTGSFTDQGKGKTAGLQEINGGADVLFPAAGASGLGTLTAADQRHVWGIGVDADQNFLHPNSTVTSVVKHVEVAVAAAIVADSKGKFKAGTLIWNLKNNGVGLAPYHGLSSKVPAAVTAAVTKARAGIISGKIVVPSK
ncbi:MAG: bmpA [Chloroflexi bacterium]|nr:bmpA [Chloroflexota bacterium]